MYQILENLRYEFFIDLLIYLIAIFVPISRKEETFDKTSIASFLIMITPFHLASIIDLYDLCTVFSCCHLVDFIRSLSFDLEANLLR